MPSGHGHEQRRRPPSAVAPLMAPAPSRPRRPTLTLKSLAPSGPVVPDQVLPAPLVAPEAAAALPTPPPAPEAACPRGKPAQALRLWTRSRGPVVARGSGLARARELNALLLAPIGVLPGTEGELVRPFRIGLGAEIVARRRPEVEIATCQEAIRAYARSFSYRLATAQPGAMRHDLDGHSVELVSDEDRRFAQHSCEVDQKRSRQRKAAALTEPAAFCIEPDGVDALAPSR